MSTEVRNPGCVTGIRVRERQGVRTKQTTEEGVRPRERCHDPVPWSSRPE